MRCTGRRFQEQPITKILVVDDEIDVADSLVELFEAMGHEVAVGYHGGQALELSETFDPHIVFLDLQMPVVDGFEAARSIRRSTRSDHPFLVASTALRGAAMEQEAIGAGFDLYVHKPADTNVLLTLVASLEDRDSPSKPKAWLEAGCKTRDQAIKPIGVSRGKAAGRVTPAVRRRGCGAPGSSSKSRA